MIGELGRKRRSSPSLRSWMGMRQKMTTTFYRSGICFLNTPTHFSSRMRWGLEQVLQSCRTPEAEYAGRTRERLKWGCVQSSETGCTRHCTRASAAERG